jgi:hypothetical protein
MPIKQQPSFLLLPSGSAAALVSFSSSDFLLLLCPADFSWLVSSSSGRSRPDPIFSSSSFDRSVESI